VIGWEDGGERRLERFFFYLLKTYQCWNVITLFVMSVLGKSLTYTSKYYGGTISLLNETPRQTTTQLEE
jgi:hypothetical protein